MAWACPAHVPVAVVWVGRIYYTYSGSKPSSCHADAFAAFVGDAQGQATRIQMRPISAAVDNSYDFQDLDLQRVTTAPAK